MKLPLEVEELVRDKFDLSLRRMSHLQLAELLVYIHNRCNDVWSATAVVLARMRRSFPTSARSMLSQRASDSSGDNSKMWADLLKRFDNDVIPEPWQKRQSAKTSVATSPEARRSLLAPYLLKRCEALFFEQVAPNLLPSLQTFTRPLSLNVVPNIEFPVPKWLTPDFVIEVEEVRMQVHSWVLYGRWTWFKSLVESGFAEAVAKCAPLPSNTLMPITFLALLVYIYTSQVDLFKTADLCMEVLKSAEILSLFVFGQTPYVASPGYESLIAHCQHQLTQKLTRENCLDRLKVAIEFGTTKQITPIKAYVVSELHHLKKDTNFNTSLWELNDQAIIDELRSLTQQLSKKKKKKKKIVTDELAGLTL